MPQHFRVIRLLAQRLRGGVPQLRAEVRERRRAGLRIVGRLRLAYGKVPVTFPDLIRHAKGGVRCNRNLRSTAQ
jgi:hypothetical protein